MEVMVDARGQLNGRVRRRRALVACMAAALVLFCAAVAVAATRSGGSTPRQVGVRGAANAVTSSTTGTPVVAASPSSVPPGPASSVPVIGRVATTTVAPVAPSPPSPSTTAGVPSSSTAPPAGAAQVGGTVLFSPVCPVEQIPPLPACAPRPGPAHIELVRSDGSVAAAGDAGNDGHFVLAVPSGHYNVTATSGTSPSTIGRGCRATPAAVTVAPGSVTTVDVACDTGIR
jgi:hypothetical protein